jgi:hypothetical protein
MKSLTHDRPDSAYHPEIPTRKQHNSTQVIYGKSVAVVNEIVIILNSLGMHDDGS